MVSNGKDEEKRGGADEGDKVDGGEAGGRDGAKDSDGDAKDDADVKDIRAEDIAEDEFRLAFSGGDDGSDELGQRGAEGDDGKSNDALGDADGSGEVGSGIYDEVRADDDAGEAKGRKEQRRAELPFGLFWLGLLFVAGMEGHRNEIIEEDGEKEQDGDAVRAGDLVDFGGVELDVEEEHDQERGDEDTDGDFFADSLLADGERANKGGEAEDKQDIEDVGADDVAKHHVGGAGGEGLDRDSELGRGSAKGDDGEANEGLRHFEIGSSGGGAIHEEVGALDEQNKANDEQNYL